MEIVFKKEKSGNTEMCVYFLRTLFPIENMIQLYGLKSSANVRVLEYLCL